MFLTMIDLTAFTTKQLQEAASTAQVVECEPDPRRRALAAYFRSGSVEPPKNGAVPLRHDGKTYLALIGAEQLLAVYRVRSDLQLKRLRRIPLPVAAAAELTRLGHTFSQGTTS